jgi:predicted aspartyl protease
MVNVVIRSTIAGEKFMASPALVDYGADYSAITSEIFKRLMPPRNGTVYIESYEGKGNFVPLYSVNIEIHRWVFREIEVVVGDDDYVILGRDILNHFDLRLNGIDGKLEFLRGPQSPTII